jgi:hypothetical protein
MFVYMYMCIVVYAYIFYICIDLTYTMTITQLEYIVALAEHQNFSKAKDIIFHQNTDRLQQQLLVHQGVFATCLRNMAP